MDLTLGLHPKLLEKVNKILAAMSALGFPMRICQGVRTAEQQGKLYAQGRTEKGSIVTNADGVKNKSNHQPHEDGFGYAVDCCFLGTDPFLEKDPQSLLKWNLYGMCCEILNLTWGGRWKLVDKPHCELKNGL